MSIETSIQIEENIDQVVEPRETEWYRGSTRERFVRAAKRMACHGMPVPEIIDILSDLYGAVAAEYGD